jgi:hypothetical protein
MMRICRRCCRSTRTGRARAASRGGIQRALERILVSPYFLFRAERAPAQAAGRISDLELASRLSFFLWSSIPDDELIDAAAHNALSAPAELERQVKRMLADPRASALVDNFAAQWLFLRNVDAAAPDPRVFPDFDEALRRAMRRETELFVHDVLANDRSVTELLTADYTFLNERLARHYGVAGVYGDQFRRVSLAGTPRRGLLGHASLLTVTSYAHRTSPVLRGKWMLDNLLGAPPPPPPPDIPALQETNTKTGKALTMREGDGATPRQPVMRQLPCADGPARFRARELRCGGPVAHAGGQPGNRRVGRAA